MLRIRFPAGSVLPDSLRRLGKIASAHGNGVLHITTRQEFRVHRVPLDSILPALRALAAAGLYTKGSGGNTVRNVTAFFDSGVCPHELFDVVPYAVALTERLTPDLLSFRLPRKYKIAFAACARDCPGATVNDVGFIAAKKMAPTAAHEANQRTARVRKPSFASKARSKDGPDFTVTPKR